MSIFRQIKFLAAGAALAAALWGAQAAAQGEAEWLYRTAFEVQSLDAACLPEGRARSVHILGVTGEADLAETERGRIAADLSDLLASRLSVRVTKADTLGRIAGALGADGSDELAALVEGTSRADVTLLVTPLERRGARLAAEIRLWTRDEGGLACAPSFRVTIPLQAADPACARGYELARASEDVARLEAFAEFFPHCPEAVTARTAARELKAAEDAARLSESCEAAFQAAHAARTSEALDGFLGRGTACPQYQAALLLRQTLRAQEDCADAYAETTRAHTEDAYAAFLREHATCAEAGGAAAQLTALRAAPAPSAPAAAPAPREPDTFAIAPPWREAVIDDPDGYTNVRAGPGTSHAILGRILAGEVFAALPDGGRWWRVRSRGGLSGYMHVSRIALGAAPAAAPAPTRAPAWAPRFGGERVTVWDHNGSRMAWESAGTRRWIWYWSPRAGLVREGVAPGQLLFDGTLADGRIDGTARVFSRTCGPAAYRVAGRVSQQPSGAGPRVTLHGQAPRRDAACARIGLREDRLVFDYLAAAPF